MYIKKTDTPYDTSYNVKDFVKVILLDQLWTQWNYLSSIVEINVNNLKKEPINSAVFLNKIITEWFTEI